METPRVRPRLLAGAAADLVLRSRPGAARATTPDFALDFALDIAPDFALDIALDEALVTRAADVVRVWRPRGRAAVLGVASEAAAELVLDSCRADRLPVLRRSTGGAAVLVTPEVACVSLVMPHSRCPEAKSISGAYRLAFEGLARAFGSLGLDVDFERPGDVALSGRKLVGLAQARRRHATLVHGVVPVGLDCALLERYLAHPPAEPAYRSGRRHGEFVTTLAREIGAHDLEGLMQRTLSALARGLSGEGAGGPCPADLAEALAEARRLVDERYGRDEWTFRR